MSLEFRRLYGLLSVHKEVLDQTEYQELDGLSFCKKDFFLWTMSLNAFVDNHWCVVNW